MLTRITKDFWAYLGETQSKNIRILHIAIASLIIVQIINSNFINIQGKQLNWGAWVHIFIGIIITIISIDFTYSRFQEKSVKYFYPYLFADFSQIKKDFNLLFKFKLPKANPYGLAATIQGLGLSALFLVILSGLSWFTCWLLELHIANNLLNIHKFLTGFIEAYIIAHGAMGTLHFIAKKWFPQCIET